MLGKFGVRAERGHPQAGRTGPAGVRQQRPDPRAGRLRSGHGDLCGVAVRVGVVDRHGDETTFVAAWSFDGQLQVCAGLPIDLLVVVAVECGGVRGGGALGGAAGDRRQRGGRSHRGEDGRTAGTAGRVGFGHRYSQSVVGRTAEKVGPRGPPGTWAELP